MNFESLPTEIHTLIVEQVYRADLKYRHYRSKVIKKGKQTEDEKVKGRALEALSLVSVGCRELSIPYLMVVSRSNLYGSQIDNSKLIFRISLANKTLRSSRVKLPIFETCILTSPAVNAITTFEIDTADFDSFSFAVLYVLPHLPNFHRFVTSNNVNLATFASVPMSAKPWDRQPHVLKAFLKLADRITEWEVPLSGTTWLPQFIFSKPQVVRSLAARSAEHHSSHPLELAASSFLPGLASCSSLENLVLRIPKNSRDTPLIHPNTAVTPFLFASTLTSLDISVLSRLPFPSLLDDSIFDLILVFQSLRQLRLSTTLQPNLNENKIRLPNLLRLEIELAQFYSIPTFLNRFELPQIRVLHVHLLDGNRMAKAVFEDSDILENVADSINKFETTLLEFHLHDTIGMYSQDQANFVSLLNPPIYYNHWSEGSAEAKVTAYPDAIWGWDVPEEDELVESLSDAVQHLGQWTKKEAKRLQKEGNLKGIKGLWDALADVRENKEWMEDCSF